jgi:predicted nucleotide-binding protein (sugar kinase/HSP70/actin superfamily)
MHPYFKLSPFFELRMVWGLAIIDGLESLRRRVRPYEAEKGETDAVFDMSIARVAKGLESGAGRALWALRAAVRDFNAIRVDASKQRPKVFVIGDFLLNFHPGANNDIVRYLEDNGMEVLFPDILNVFRKDYLRMLDEMRHFHAKYPLGQAIMVHVANLIFRRAIAKVRRIMSGAQHFQEKADLRDLTAYAEGIIDTTFTSGEGWMIAAEILHQASEGVDSFVILQPFGCMPNHVTGRGIVKAIKERYPRIQLVSLDYDPDTSVANIENRLQMLIINAKAMAQASSAAADAPAKVG